MSRFKILSLLSISILTLSSCTGDFASYYDPAKNDTQAETVKIEPTVTVETNDSDFEEIRDVTVPTYNSEGVRDNTPLILTPAWDGTAAAKNDVAVIDYSHADQGYISACYTGDIKKIKLRITGDDEIVYTYDLHKARGYEVFPLSSGSGTYTIVIYENISGTNYSTCLTATIDVTLANDFLPFLYPNQYVNFNEDSLAVDKAVELAEGCTNDLEVITNVYDYITETIKYDYDVAADPPTDYTTDIDEIMTSGTGICLDYAAVMASMLRSQGIPTHLEVGYAQDAKHAWISVYTPETGWLNGIVEFDGSIWTLVDPTFGANSSKTALKKFIGDGTNYVLQKVY